MLTLKHFLRKLCRKFFGQYFLPFTAVYFALLYIIVLLWAFQAKNLHWTLPMQSQFRPFATSGITVRARSKWPSSLPIFCRPSLLNYHWSYGSDAMKRNRKRQRMPFLLILNSEHHFGWHFDCSYKDSILIGCSMRV